MNKVGNIIKRWFNSLEPVDIALIFTLILVFTYSEDVLGIRRPMQIITGVGLIFYRFIGKNPYFWAVITILLAIGHSYLWFSIDNHKYLMNYWCLAICTTLFFKDYKPLLRTNAQILLGFCFLFATLWKVTTPEYINGSFFEYLLIGGDERFDGFSKIVTGISETTLTENKQTIKFLASGSTISLELISGTRIKIVAQLMTWWTVIIEGIIAFFSYSINIFLSTE